MIALARLAASTRRVLGWTGFVVLCRVDDTSVLAFIVSVFVDDGMVGGRYAKV